MTRKTLCKHDVQIIDTRINGYKIISASIAFIAMDAVIYFMYPDFFLNGFSVVPFTIGMVLGINGIRHKPRFIGRCKKCNEKIIIK